MRVSVLVFAVELQKVSAHHLSSLRFWRGLFKTACTWRVEGGSIEKYVFILFYGIYNEIEQLAEGQNVIKMKL